MSCGRLMAAEGFCRCTKPQFDVQNLHAPEPGMEKSTALACVENPVAKRLRRFLGQLAFGLLKNEVTDLPDS